MAFERNQLGLETLESKEVTKDPVMDSSKIVNLVHVAIVHNNVLNKDELAAYEASNPRIYYVENQIHIIIDHHFLFTPEILEDIKNSVQDQINSYNNENNTNISEIELIIRNETYLYSPERESRLLELIQTQVLNYIQTGPRLYDSYDIASIVSIAAIESNSSGPTALGIKILDCLNAKAPELYKFFIEIAVIEDLFTTDKVIDRIPVLNTYNNLLMSFCLKYIHPLLRNYASNGESKLNNFEDPNFDYIDFFSNYCDHNILKEPNINLFFELLYKELKQISESHQLNIYERYLEIEKKINQLKLQVEKEYKNNLSNILPVLESLLSGKSAGNTILNPRAQAEIIDLKRKLANLEGQLDTVRSQEGRYPGGINSKGVNIAPDIERSKSLLNLNILSTKNKISSLQNKYLNTKKQIESKLKEFINYLEKAGINYFEYIHDDPDVDPAKFYLMVEESDPIYCKLQNVLGDIEHNTEGYIIGKGVYYPELIKYLASNIDLFKGNETRGIEAFGNLKEFLTKEASVSSNFKSEFIPTVEIDFGGEAEINYPISPDALALFQSITTNHNGGVTIGEFFTNLEKPNNDTRKPEYVGEVARTCPSDLALVSFVKAVDGDTLDQLNKDNLVSQRVTKRIENADVEGAHWVKMCIGKPGALFVPCGQYKFLGYQSSQKIELEVKSLKDTRAVAEINCKSYLDKPTEITLYFKPMQKTDEKTEKYEVPYLTPKYFDNISTFETVGDLNWSDWGLDKNDPLYPQLTNLYKKRSDYSQSEILDKLKEIFKNRGIIYNFTNIYAYPSTYQRNVAESFKNISRGGICQDMCKMFGACLRIFGFKVVDLFVTTPANVKDEKGAGRVLNINSHQILAFIVENKHGNKDVVYFDPIGLTKSGPGAEYLNSLTRLYELKILYREEKATEKNKLSKDLRKANQSLKKVFEMYKVEFIILYKLMAYKTFANDFSTDFIKKQLYEALRGKSDAWEFKALSLYIQDIFATINNFIYLPEREKYVPANESDEVLRSYGNPKEIKEKFESNKVEMQEIYKIINQVYKEYQSNPIKSEHLNILERLIKLQSVLEMDNLIK